MKSIGNCLKLALFASLFSIAAISCSNEEFFGFEDIDAQYDLYSEMVSDNTNKYTAQNRSALSRSDTLMIKIASEKLSEYLILTDDNHLIIPKNVSADFLMIDEDLFCYLSRLLDIYNINPPRTIIHKTEKIKRLKGRNNEGGGTRGNSLMADAIACLVWDIATDLHLDFTAELFYEWYFYNRSAPYYIQNNRWEKIEQYANEKAGNSGFKDTIIDGITYRYKSLSFYEAGPNIGFALGTATIYVNASYQVIGLRDKYNFEAGDRNFVNEELTQFLGLLGTGYFPVYYGTHIDY